MGKISKSRQTFLIASNLGKDVVAQFVSSCKKYNVKPCYYMGPNANGWLSNHQKYSAESFVIAQLGMLRELLTKYAYAYFFSLFLVINICLFHYKELCYMLFI